MRMSALLLCTLACAAPPTLATDDRQPVVFIGCPIYRDTDAGRKSGCWLADDPASGVRYDVTEAPMKPELGRQILVEGIRTQEPDSCGGVVLQPVRTAVLEATCPKALLPAETWPGRAFRLPAEISQPIWVPRPVPLPPYATQEFVLLFDFGREFLVYQHAEVVLERAAAYARAGNAPVIEVIGYAATRPIEVSGRMLREPPALGQARAELAAEALARLGVSRSKLKITWQENPPPLDGLRAPTPDSTQRRVVIRILP
jgi:hypothetical protein